MLSLGLIEEWLDATARNPEGSAVRFSSLFPFQGETRFVVPPKTVWPPAASARVRWKGARFIPLSLVETLVNGGAPEEDRWQVDGAGGWLLSEGGPAAFRVGGRPSAGGERLGGRGRAGGRAVVGVAPGVGRALAIWSHREV